MIPEGQPVRWSAGDQQLDATVVSAETRYDLLLADGRRVYGVHPSRLLPAGPVIRGRLELPVPRPPAALGISETEGGRVDLDALGGEA